MTQQRVRITIWARPDHYKNFRYAQDQRNLNSPSKVTFTHLGYDWLQSFPEAPADYVPEKLQKRRKAPHRQKRAA